MYFFNIYAANITNEMLFTCFFDGPMLNIVCVFGLFVCFLHLWVSFLCFFKFDLLRCNKVCPLCRVLFDTNY